jgi:hypothetical protein
MFAVLKTANLRECIKLPVVDVIFWRYTAGQCYWIFYEDCFFEYFFGALNILRCNLMNISDVVLNIFAKILNIFR